MLKNENDIHLVDLFSGFSVVHLCEKDAPNSSDVIHALRKWMERFGRVPVVFFSDQGAIVDISHM